MKRYKIESAFVTRGFKRVVAELRLMEARVNEPTGRGRVDVSPLVRLFQCCGELWLPRSKGDQYWSEGRATPTFRTFREGVRVLGAAWWASPGGWLHCRVVGARIFAANVNALKAAVRPWGLYTSHDLAAQDVSYVYPALWMPPPPRHQRGVMAEFCRALTVDPLDWPSWYAMADWMLDNGAPESSATAREAGALAHCLALGAKDGETYPERIGDE